MASATAGIGTAAEKSAAQASKAGGVFKTALGTAIGFAGAQAGIAAIGAGFRAVTGGAIGMNSVLETSQLQFETLLGDADKAKAHVASLFAFAASTPFETGPIIEASRLMLTFGGAALDTEKNLRLVGDAAAGTSQTINEVAFWFGRAYSAIQAGQPFGEASMRLMEMGILTGDSRNKLEKLQATGASSTEVWNEFTKSFGRFDGAMLKQANTMQGLTSTISDNVKILEAKIGKAFYDRILKPGLFQLATFLQSAAVEKAADRMAKGLDRAITVVGKSLKSLRLTLRDLVGDPMVFFREGLKLPEPLAKALSNVVVFLTRDLVDLGKQLPWVGRYLFEVAKSGDLANGYLDALSPTVYQVARLFGILIEILKQVGRDLIQIANFGVKVVTFFANLAERLGLFRSAGDGTVSMLDKLQANIDLVAAAISGWLAVMVVKSILDFAAGVAQLAFQFATFPLRVLQNISKEVFQFGENALNATKKVADFLAKVAGLAGQVGKGVGGLAMAATQTITQLVVRSAEATKALTEDIADRIQTITQSVKIDVKAADATKVGTKTGISFGTSMLAGIGGTVGGGIASVLMAATPPGWVVAAIIGAAIAVALIFAFRKQIWAGMKEVWANLPEIIGTAVGGAAAFILLTLLLPFVAIYELFKQALVPAGEAVVDFFSGLPGTIGDALEGDAIGRAFGKGFDAVLGFFAELPGKILDALSDLPGLLADFFTGLPATIGGLVSEGFRREVEGWKAILSGDFIEGVNGIFLGLPGIIAEAISSIPGLVSETFTTAYETVAEIFSGLPETIGETLSSVGETIGTFLSDTASSVASWGIVGWFTDILGRVWTAAAGTFDAILKKVSDVIGINIPAEFTKLVGFLIGLGPTLLTFATMLGANIYQGISTGISGLGHLVGAALDAVIGAVESAINAAIDAYNKVADFPINPMPHVGAVTLPRTGLAEGVRNFAGGLALLGEKGLPELAVLPKGTDVFSGRETSRILDAVAGLGVRSPAALAASSTSIAAPISISLQMIDWASIRRVILAEVEGALGQAESQSRRAGAILSTGLA